jgi:hypothetical protein
MDEALGMPARVVVGFHAGTAEGHGTFAVHPVDAFAWVEVDFQGAGWVPFILATLQNSPVPPVDKTDQSTSKLSSSPNQPSAHGGGVIQKATKAQLHISGGTSFAVVLVVTGISMLVLLIVAGLLSLAVRVARVRRRRARRSTGDARDQVIGAWEESLDELVSVGVRRKPADTADEIVESSSDRLGSETRRDLVPLGYLANAARYSGRIPVEADVDRAWEHADNVSEAANASLTRWGRVRRAIDVRVLYGGPLRKT